MNTAIKWINIYAVTENVYRIYERVAGVECTHLLPEPELLLKDVDEMVDIFEQSLLEPTETSWNGLITEKIMPRLGSSSEATMTYELVKEGFSSLLVVFPNSLNWGWSLYFNRLSRTASQLTCTPLPPITASKQEKPLPSKSTFTSSTDVAGNPAELVKDRSRPKGSAILSVNISEEKMDKKTTLKGLICLCEDTVW